MMNNLDTFLTSLIEGVVFISFMISVLLLFLVLSV